MFVGALWGCTNPLLKQGSGSAAYQRTSDSFGQYVYEFYCTLTNWKVSTPMHVSLRGELINALFVDDQTDGLNSLIVLTRVSATSVALLYVDVNEEEVIITRHHTHTLPLTWTDASVVAEIMDGPHVWLACPSQSESQLLTVQRNELHVLYLILPQPYAFQSAHLIANAAVDPTTPSTSLDLHLLGHHPSLGHSTPTSTSHVSTTSPPPFETAIAACSTKRAVASETVLAIAFGHLVHFSNVHSAILNDFACDGGDQVLLVSHKPEDERRWVLTDVMSTVVQASAANGGGITQHRTIRSKKSRRKTAHADDNSIQVLVNKLAAPAQADKCHVALAPGLHRRPHVDLHVLGTWGGQPDCLLFDGGRVRVDITDILTLPSVRAPHLGIRHLGLTINAIKAGMAAVTVSAPNAGMLECQLRQVHSELTPHDIFALENPLDPTHIQLIQAVLSAMQTELAFESTAQPTPDGRASVQLALDRAMGDLHLAMKRRSDRLQRG
ncbi:hypothetical protein DYB37_009335 [Aphanomyces astaci]|uniref:Uncharacterized protein n=1 Tax=Aphanomyces astaci TaxID=112090 RepID=A0A3R7C0F4_APHAT|nr:hypothetical protein DYB37_009335 [Aphanomyces astaci]